MIDGLLLLTPEVALYAAAGVMICTFVVIIPGLGGTFALAILLPFIFRLDPVTGIAFMLAINVVNGTGNTITSVLFGVPGSASGVASMFDGYPMTRRGEGIRAVAAGLTSSALGGLIGAAVLAVSLPFLRPIVLAFRPPEFFMLILLALVLMAFIAGADKLKALISAGLGLMISFVGMERTTGTQRYTFGELYLWDGLHIVPVLLGLYALAEMISLMRRGGAIAQRTPQESPVAQVLRGVRDTLRHWKAVVQSAAAGLWIGLAPGLGDSVAQFVGYTQVARTSKNRANFGKGEIEGVIAADAATNAKDGGSLIPTLAFGVPGSTSMAIVIAGFLAFGLQPGPEMLTEHVDIVWMIIWIMVFANLFAALLCMFITPFMAKVTSLRASLIVPPILVMCMFGAYSANGHILDIGVLLLFGIVGVGLKEFGYSRPLFLIGFVLGYLLEQNYLLSTQLFGAGFLARPIVLILVGVGVLVVASPLLGAAGRRLFRRGRGGEDAGSRAAAPEPTPEPGDAVSPGTERADAERAKAEKTDAERDTRSRR
jgi:putative tricarboxylic transport membrane protein